MGHFLKIKIRIPLVASVSSVFASLVSVALVSVALVSTVVPIDSPIVISSVNRLTDVLIEPINNKGVGFSSKVSSLLQAV